MKLKLVIAIVLLLALGGGCAEDGAVEPESGQPDVYKITDGYVTIYRVVDEQYGVVCYTIFNDAIDCLPLSETKRGKDDNN